MLLRRLIGFPLTLFTFHLMLVGADDVCAKHVHPSLESVAPKLMTMVHGSTDTDMEHGTSNAPCDTPASAHCCDAFASCTVTVALEANEHATAGPTVTPGVPASIDEPLVSRALGPEPPPPKR